jgi:hypothetical protein
LEPAAPSRDCSRTSARADIWPRSFGCLTARIRANYVEVIEGDDEATVAQHAQVLPEPPAGSDGNAPFAIATYDYKADEANELCASPFCFSPGLVA